MGDGEKGELYKKSGQEQDKRVAYFDKTFVGPKCFLCHAKLRVTKDCKDGLCMTTGCHRNKMFKEIDKIMNPV